MRRSVLVVAAAVLSLGAPLVSGPADALAPSPVVPLTDGVGTDPWSMDIVGVTPTDVVVTETNPTNLTLGTRVGPVLAVPRDGSPARVLDLPPGRLLVAGTVVMSEDQGTGGTTWIDLATEATGTGTAVYGEQYTQQGALRLTVPVDLGPTHLVRRDVRTGADTDLGEVPDLTPYSGIVAGASSTVVYSTTVHQAEVLQPGGGFVTLALPVGAVSCPSVSADALGCWSAGTVYRVPLDGSTPIVSSSSSYTSFVAVTPTRTVWIDAATNGLALQAAAGGVVRRTTADVGAALNAAGPDVYVVLAGGVGAAGLGVLHPGANEPALLLKAAAAPLAVGSLLQSTGRVLWAEGYESTFHARRTRVADGELRLGTPGRIVPTGSLVGVSGTYQVSAVQVSGGTPTRSRVDLYAGEPYNDSFLRSAVGGTARISGDRVSFGWAPPTGPVRLGVEDLRTGVTKLLPELGTDPDQPVYQFWGDAIAYLEPDASVWYRNISTGQTIEVAPAGSSAGGLQLWGDVVAWSTSCCSSDAAQWTWADVHHLDALTSGQLVRLTNDGALLNLNPSSNDSGPLALQAYGDTAQTTVADDALTASASADGPVAAWIDPTDLQPRGRAIAATGGRPRALSAVLAPTGPDSNGTWAVRVPASTRLTTCQVVLRDAGNAVVQTVPCDPLAMDLGVASVSVASFYGNGSFPAGAYSWTLEAGNEDGALLGLDGSPATWSGTAYSPSDVTITKYVTPTTVVAGHRFTLTAAASGIPTPTVQWYRSTVLYTQGSPIPGATSPTYTAIATPAMNGNVFRALFTNGWIAADTGIVLDVLFAPKVTAAPRSVTVKAGKVAVFTATASANPGAKVRWQYSADRGAHWRSLASTTGSVRVAALRSRNGWRVRAVFSNAYGTAATTAAVLRVT